MSSTFQTAVDISNYAAALEQVRHPSSSFAPPSDTRGRVRSAYFKFTNSADVTWSDDDGSGAAHLALAIIPPYARIQEIELVHNALSADDAGNTITVGLVGLDSSGFISRAKSGGNAQADDLDFFGSIAGAGEYDSADLKRFGAAIADNYGYRTEKAVLLVAALTMNSSPGIDEDDGEIRGFARYVVD